MKRSKPRVTGIADVASFDSDDQAAQALLDGPLRIPGLETAAEPLSVGYLTGISPLCDAAAVCLGIATAKAQARGRIPHLAHEWADQVIGFDLPGPGRCNSIVARHLPLAVAAGIRLEAIEALRDGRVDDFTAEEHDFIDFVRAVYSGTVTDKLWNRAVDRIGSERGAVEHVWQIMMLFAYVRVEQALGTDDYLDDTDLTELLEAFREGRQAPGDLPEYDRTQTERPWPRLPREWCEHHWQD